METTPGHGIWGSLEKSSKIAQHCKLHVTHFDEILYSIQPTSTIHILNFYYFLRGWWHSFNCMPCIAMISCTESWISFLATAFDSLKNNLTTSNLNFRLHSYSKWRAATTEPVGSHRIDESRNQFGEVWPMHSLPATYPRRPICSTNGDK